MMQSTVTKNSFLVLGLLTCLFLMGCSFSKKEKESDRSLEGLKGEVKSVHQFTYKALEKFGEVVQGKRWNAKLEDFNSIYTQNGNEIEKNELRINGSLSRKLTSKYDEKGNKIESNCYNADGSLDEKWTYKYDEKGNKIESNRYKADGSLYLKLTYKYDEKGNKIEQNSYNVDGSLDEKWTYKYDYDKIGNWVKKIQYKDDRPVLITIREIEYFDE